MTVGELLARCDSRELSEWMAYDRIKEPADSESWHQTAQICTVLDQLWSKKPRPFDAFLPRKKTAKPAITADAIRARLAPFRAPPKSRI